MTDGAGLRQAARRIRAGILELSHRGQSAHIGSCLSVADILAAVYWGGLAITPENIASPDRDRLLFGKGHAAAAILAALAERGFFPREKLADFNRDGGELQEHPGPGWPAGVEIAAGSLGYAPPLAAGLALAARIQGRNFRVCAVMGDGECEEGSVWEAAMFAGGKQLVNLAALIDANSWQATGRTAEITGLEPLGIKWEAFGWRARELDGHNPEEIRTALAEFGRGDRPVALIARTVKGKGVSFMEDDNNWHYRTLSDGDLAKALRELKDGT
ncbi:MAG: transketolase [Planctomycetota bacterium]|nr:transketolase [Planctomycetota bacterium]